MPNLAGSILLPGLPPTSYYAPNFRLEVEGFELDADTKGDVLDLRVTMDLANLTSFELTLNNWDDVGMFFKHSDERTFNIGNRVQVYMGYADKLKFMGTGQISALSPRFPESGAPTLGVTAVDAMVRLRDRKPADGEMKNFVKKTDSEIAEIVGRRNDLDVIVDETNEKHALVVQKNQDEAQFLMERAKRIDFDCYIYMNPDTHRDTLHFVRPTDGRGGKRTRVFEFEWGKSLINFTPHLSAGRQVGKVTVRGWDPATKKRISYTADPAIDLPPAQGGMSGPAAAKEHFKDKQEMVVDQPVTSAQEARDLAISLLRERAYEFLTGSGEVIGMADLRPGDNVKLKQLGRRFSGDYYATKVVHSLGSSGFQTQFDVRRLEDGGIES